MVPEERSPGRADIMAFFNWPAVAAAAAKAGEAAETVARVARAGAAVGNAVAGASPTHRQCNIEITNACSQHALSEPRVHVISGHCANPLPPHLPPSSSGTAEFRKTLHTARGAVGVFTYNLVDEQTKRTTGKMAVMFSVPYDYNLYSNWYAVGIFDKSTECDYDLYCQMYNKYKDSLFIRDKASGSSVKFQKGQVTIMASMSDDFSPVIKVQVKDN